MTVDLNTQGVAQNTVAAGSDTLIGIENLVGSALNDTLTGDGNDNVIEGGLGNDTLIGGAGNDTASYAGAAAGVTVSLALQGAGQNTVNAGTDTLSGFENLLGSAFDDSLTGDANANTISGGAGNDTLNPGANARGIVDLLDGGAGSDTASFAGLGRCHGHAERRVRWDCHRSAARRSRPCATSRICSAARTPTR